MTEDEKVDDIVFCSWRRIDTAPMDGSLVDLWWVYDGKGSRLCDCFWSNDGTTPGWRHRSPDGFVLELIPDDLRKATHWMPTPGAPDID